MPQATLGTLPSDIRGLKQKLKFALSQFGRNEINFVFVYEDTGMHSLIAQTVTSVIDYARLFRFLFLFLSACN